MAENKSQAQHLVSLDFDISGIIESLRQVDEQTQKYALEIGKNFYNNFQKSINDIQSSSEITAPKIVDDKTIQSAAEQVKRLDSEYGKLAKTVTSFNATGDLATRRETYINDNQIQTVLRYNSALEQTGKTVTENQARQEKQTQQFISQIDRMIEKQKTFNATVSQQRNSRTNRDIINQSNQYITDLGKLRDQISDTGKVTEQQKTQINEYSSKIRELSGYYQDAGTKGESFLQKISDKAKWLGAFYVVNELRQGLIQTIDIIKSTEDAVVSLQRVLNDDTISQSRITDELYDIAVEYGRTFDEVSEVAQQFVQAGNNWTDTVELTRGTMLALNTAELDVTQSTEGLIAVMAQWNLEADDYAELIDKINITADDFAVTSEKIVSALQRSSSSARNANISLEETIGIITALAEATGRSGENIGTALNSLIIYTSSADALRTFAEVGSDAMKQVVEEYQRGAVSIYDVWKQLSKEVANLNEQQQKVLFESDDFQGLAETLETELNDVYGAVGTYRQNYFIALLNDIETAEEAIRGMSDASGYSMNENQKYMESLTASWNQLQALLSELAVQLGEAGLMDTLKWLVQIGINLTELTKSLGGILPLLTALAGIILVIKAQKIGDSLSNLSKSFSALKTNITSFIALVSQAQGTMGKLKAATTLLSGAFSSFVSILGIATAAVSAITMIYNSITQAIEDARNRRIEANKAVLEETDGIEDLISRYESLSNVYGRTLEQEKEFSTVNSQLVSILGDKARTLDGLTQGTNEYAEALRKATKEQLELNRATLESQMKEYEDALKSEFSWGGGNLWLLGNEKIDEDINDILTQNLGRFYNLNAGGAPYFAPSNLDPETLLDYYAGLERTKQGLDELAATSQEAGERVGRSEVYSDLTETINSLNDSINNTIGSMVDYYINEEAINGNIPTTVEELDKFREKIIELTDVDEIFNEQIEELIDDKFPSLAEAAAEAGENISDSFSISQEEIDEFKEKIDELNDSINGFQSGFDTVISAIDEFNQTGYLSVDTIQALVSAGSDYISMLDFTAKGVRLNEEAVNRLIREQETNINEMLQQAMVAEVLETVQRYLAKSTDEVEESTEKSGETAETTAEKIANLATQAMNATISMTEFNASLRDEVPDVSDYQGLQSELTSIINRYKTLSNVIGNLSVNRSAWSQNAAQSAEKAAKEQTDAIKKQLEAQKEAVKDRYDAEIQALRDVQEENDRLQKQEEYYRNRREALNDIEQASTRSGVEYREQESEARQRLEELDREWEQTVADWSIEDKIAELEALRDAEIAAIDAQIDALEGTVSSMSTSMVNSYSIANKTMLSNYETDYLAPLQEETALAYEETFENIPNVFSENLNELLDLTKANAIEMYNIYNENFFSKMKQSILELQQAMVATKVYLPTVPWLSSLTPFGTVSNQNVVNNNNNSNVFANVYSQSAATALINGIFRKP